MISNNNCKLPAANTLIGSNSFLKQTDIGKIPVDWEITSIGQLCNVTSGGTPSRDNPDYWNGNIPWVKTGEINYSEIKDTEEKITQEGLDNSSAKLVPPGTILMAMYGQGVTRGKVAILCTKAALNQACLAIIPNHKIYNKFLYYWLVNQYNELRNIGNETTQKNLNASLVKEINFPLPPLTEQKKIAAILSSVDEAIAKTQAVIDQTRKVKQGLLQHLLTRGVGHTKFKDSAIGKIPESWDVVELKKLLSKGIQNGYSPICPKEVTGHWILSLGAVSPDGFNKSCVKPAPINDLKVFEFILEPGDFLISRSNTRDRVGFSAVFKGELNNCSYPDLLMRFRINNNLMLNDFLEIYLTSSTALEYLQNAAAGTSGSMVKITKSVVEKLQVPIPTLLEQQQICQTIQEIQKAVKHAHQGIETLTITKSGLMQDLLTGRVRVKDA